MLNFCQSVVGYIEGLGLDPADISHQDMLDIGVCYKGMPGCRKRTGFVPLDQIAAEDVDPLWFEMTSCGNPIWDDLKVKDAYDDIPFDDQWDSDEIGLDAESEQLDWDTDPTDEIQIEQDRKVEREALKLAHDVWWDDADPKKLKRIDHPLRENRRQSRPLHQLPLREDLPLL